MTHKQFLGLIQAGLKNHRIEGREIHKAIGIIFLEVEGLQGQTIGLRVLFPHDPELAETADVLMDLFVGGMPYAVDPVLNPNDTPESMH